MRRAALPPAILAAALAWLDPHAALAQRALGIVVSETVEAWTVLCMRDLVTDEVACSMIAPVEAFVGQGWQPHDPAVLTVTREIADDGQPRPAIGIVAPEFSFGATFRLDARRAFQVDGRCVDADCRVADAFALPLAEELARSATAIIRGREGPDLRVQVGGYAAAWARLLTLAAERARPADQAAPLVALEPAAPPLPAAPLTNVRRRRAPSRDR